MSREQRLIIKEHIVMHTNVKYIYLIKPELNLYISKQITCNYFMCLLCVQWNLCIMDTLGPTKGVQTFQVSLYDKAPFGTIARCPDYAGVHIFKCPD